jgi:RHS repeat-associated protein
VPDAEKDVTYVYDLLGRRTAANLPGSNASKSVAWTYDNLGRLNATTTGNRSLSYQYDPGSTWMKLVHPDGKAFRYTSDVLGRVSTIAEEGVQTLATYSYDQLSRRTAISFGNGTATSYTYLTPGTSTDSYRLRGFAHNLAGTTADIGYGFAYNQVGEITTKTRDNDSYAWQNHVNTTKVYDPANGLNQYPKITVGSVVAVPTYDGRGNLANDGSWGFGYDSENRWTSTSGARNASLSYDAIGRLAQVSGNGLTNFLYDGDDLVGEYDAAGTLVRRTVHGPGVDEPIVVYEGGSKKWLYGDPQGSIIAHADASGNSTATLSYGPYGEHGLSMAGRFGYTGQMRLPEIGSFYHYKARAYAPAWGRFLQADPIGSAGGMNLYAYTDNDPINASDPSGLMPDPIIVTGRRTPISWPTYSGGGFSGLQGINSTPRGLASLPALPNFGTLATAPVAAGFIFEPYVNAYNDLIRDPFWDGLEALSDSPLGDPGLYASLRGASPVGAFAGGLGSEAAVGLRGLITLAGRGAAASKPEAYLYQKIASNGSHFKFGISANPVTRYTSSQLAGGRLKILAQGTRSEMLRLERGLHKTLPIGPQERQLQYIGVQVKSGLKPPPY